jgi:hypothetical protein
LRGRVRRDFAQALLAGDQQAATIGQGCNAPGDVRHRGVRARQHGHRAARLPHSHRKTTTLVAGLRMTGMVAPMVLDGPINGDWFEAYVWRVRVPELKPADLVIMDNQSSRKHTAARELIGEASATLRFLPPYSQTKS